MSRRTAVLVANNSYRHLPDLVAPVDEAQDLQAVLTHPEVGGFDRVELLRDESKTTVERALADTLGSAEPDDLVLIYFSGHGQLSSRGRLYLAVHNSEPSQLPATAISASWLRELLEECVAASTVILLDCCYSGAYVFASKSSPEVNLDQELKAGSGRYVLTATTAVEQAEDAGATRERSAFTEVVVKGLSTGAADLSGLGVITPEDLGRYVRNELPKYTAWQTPTMNGSVQDDVFLARVPGTRYHADADNSTIRLGELLGELTETGDVSLCAVEWRARGPLLVPIGRAFRPGMPPGEVMTLDLTGPAGNVMVVGGSGSGKSTLLRTLIAATALTHAPHEAAFYCLESGGNRLGSLRSLGHISKVAGDDQPDEVGQILAELRECLAQRKRMFRVHDIESAGRLRQLRNELPDGPHPDIFLVIDRWREFSEKFPDFSAQVQEIANSGFDYALHVVISARRWADLPEDVVELAHCQIELRAGAGGQRSAEPDRRIQLPRDRPGWALVNNRVFRVALPDISVEPSPGDPADGSGHDDGGRALLERLVVAWRWDAERPDQRQPSTMVSDLAGSPDLLRLLDVERMADIPALAHRPRSRQARLRVPLGTAPGGDIVELDLKEQAERGMGPHGLIIGAVSSGKTELLRTILVALAATHLPDELNFFLIDYKGTATFAPFSGLPHTSALVTNLLDERPLIERLAAALTGELTRRQEVLRDRGGHPSQSEYEVARAAGEPLEPMPNLLVVVDEFSELLAARPDFVEVLVQIARVGRSLGVHLLLASQRLDEGRLRGLETHLSYRIGLRTFSAAESRAVLGVPDASELPRAPGHGYLRAGVDELTRFQAAYVSGPADRAVWESVPEAGRPEPDTSVGELVLAQLDDRGEPARPLWLRPLAESPTLGAVLGRLVVDAQRGLVAPDWPVHRPLNVPVGVVDQPRFQRQDPLVLDLSGGAGNVAIVGGPRSGKSVLLRTLILALALTHTPEEAQFFCLDFSASLRSLAGLPHLSVLTAGRRDREMLRRAVSEVRAMVNDREARFTRLGVSSMAEYRHRRRGGEITDDPFGDVFLIVDGWSIIRQDYEELEPVLNDLVARGIGFGVHVIVAANRWADIRPALHDHFGTRLELRLGDPGESEIDRRLAVDVPENSPGRGLAPGKLHFLAARPGMRPGAGTDLADATAGLVAEIASTWPHPPAPKVRPLPMMLPMAELAPLVDPGAGLAIGIDEDNLAPVYLNFAAEPHFVVYGDDESGKTNLLRLIARGIVDRYTLGEARIVIADYRRTLLGAIEGEHLIGYAATSANLTGVISDLSGAMSNRLPGGDVTPAQLRERSWWQGPDLYLLIDDYDLVALGSGNPMAALTDLLPQARDIGLHVILARRTGGAGRTMFEPVLTRLRELATPVLLLDGMAEEGALVGGVKPGPQPPGRGVLVHRRWGHRLVQTAWVPPD
ncbi:hypothetical protein GCM10023322_22410 [Rugosimonospora acidiphila]|uniref:FtsK domain-containing protein n=1 Tax=Rugosimonospora acidiphila TaxID=556531 RepID=A0ABP9RR21_9ACTN